jgi:ribosomal protein S6--L-glutamate ligase
MKTVLVVNGETYWQKFLTEFKVIQKSIENTTWILKNDRLFVADKESVVEPDGILWRLGAITPSEIQTTALNLIELSGIPCVNSANTLKKGFDRLSMLAIMKSQGLPVIEFSVVTKSTYLNSVKMTFPFVVKVGNYHGGYGKVLIEDEKKWQDIKDLLFISQAYITTEPYINYKRDIRYIVINNKVWAMSRKGKYWKANIDTTDFNEIEPLKEISSKLLKLQKEIKADILAIDILEEENEKLHIVEYNDIPGLSGFGDELKSELVNVLRRKLK